MGIGGFLSNLISVGAGVATQLIGSNQARAADEAAAASAQVQAAQIAAAAQAAQTQFLVVAGVVTFLGFLLIRARK